MGWLWREFVVDLYPAFRNCTSLTSVVIPKTVVQLNKFAFSGCTGLTRVEIAPGNKCFHIENGLVISPKRRTLLFALAGLTSAVLPASVAVIVAEQLRMEDYTVPANKQAAARGFALRYASGETLSEDYRADCLKYIKSRKKKLYPVALQDPALLHVMLGEKMVPKGDLPDLIDQAAALGNAEMTWPIRKSSSSRGSGSSGKRRKRSGRWIFCSPAL